MTRHVGMLLYPGLTQLDLTGPFELLSRVPESQVHLLWKTTDPVEADSGLRMHPTTPLPDCPELEVLFVPGGRGQIALMQDEEILAFLAAEGQRARYVTSVCTGALLLGAAGLLEGYEATTHWAYMDLLPAFGARPVERRVVIDRNRVTGAGVTAGIDFGLTLVAELCGERIAQQIQLGLEYNPDPPFRAGHPGIAPPEVVAAVRERLEGVIAKRSEQVGSRKATSTSR